MVILFVLFTTLFCLCAATDLDIRAPQTTGLPNAIQSIESVACDTSNSTVTVTFSNVYAFIEAYNWQCTTLTLAV